MSIFVDEDTQKRAKNVLRWKLTFCGTEKQSLKNGTSLFKDAEGFFVETFGFLSDTQAFFLKGRRLFCVAFCEFLVCFLSVFVFVSVCFVCVCLFLCFCAFLVLCICFYV